jgi:hypothetical protein
MGQSDFKIMLGKVVWDLDSQKYIADVWANELDCSHA